MEDVCARSFEQRVLHAAIKNYSYLRTHAVWRVPYYITSVSIYRLFNHQSIFFLANHQSISYSRNSPPVWLAICFYGYIYIRGNTDKDVAAFSNQSSIY